MGKKNLSKGIIAGIWIVLVLGILLAIIEVTGVSSVEDILITAKNKASHYVECIPAGDCGIPAIVEEINESDIFNPDPQEDVIVKIPDKIDDDLDYDSITIDREVKGYRGPNKGEPYVNEAGLVNKGSALAILGEINTLQIPNEVDYSRVEWKHWSSVEGRSCWNTREEVLHRDAKPGTVIYVDKKMIATDSYEKACAIGRPVNIDGKIRVDTENSGIWIDPYSGNKITSSSDIDIDHVIPLSYAARHGGQDWDADKKQMFANDLDNLLATSAKENRRKGDKGPSNYLPPYKSYHCQYAKTFTTVAYKYDLNIAQQDYEVLEDILNSCQY